MHWTGCCRESAPPRRWARPTQASGPAWNTALGPPPPCRPLGLGHPSHSAHQGHPSRWGGAQALTALIIPLLGKYGSNDDGPGPVLGTGDSV